MPKPKLPQLQHQPLAMSAAAQRPGERRTPLAAKLNIIRYLLDARLHRQISEAAFVVALALVDWTKPTTGYANPTQKQLADRVCLGERHVRRGLLELGRLNLIVRERRRRPIRYMINWALVVTPRQPSNVVRLKRKS